MVDTGAVNRLFIEYRFTVQSDLDSTHNPVAARPYPCRYRTCMDYLPELKAVLISLSQEMKSVDDFSSICGGAVMPDVLARKWWITPLREAQWCFLARVCQKAAMSIDVQQSMERTVHQYCSRFPVLPHHPRVDGTVESVCS